MLEERRSEVLRAIVEEHIRTAEPVSSRAVLEATGLEVSAATIRNDLAALERDGYLAQPHTSAGRVPTPRGYRYYVDHLTPPPLRESAERRIEFFFSSMQVQADRLLKAATVLLSEITEYPSVAVAPTPGAERIKAAHLVQLAPAAVLLVLVTESGRVSQEPIRLPEEVMPTEVARAEQLLAQRVAGRPLGRTELVVTDEPDELPAAVRVVLREAGLALDRAGVATSEVYVGGTQRMTSIWEDLQTVRQVLELLERETMVREILAWSAGTSIQIGAEVPAGGGVDLAVVSTSFRASGSAGRLGVIGPMRMDYRRAISAVETVGRELADRIGS
jgi:heat-inducible transcriptional repressor